MVGERGSSGDSGTSLAARVRAGLETTPERLTLLYLVVGLVALLLSDVLLPLSLEDPLLWQVQAVKGVIEVLLTAGLIYVLLRASRAPLEQLNAELTRQNEELSVLHRVLRHNLRNDLNVIEGNGELLVETDDAERRGEIYGKIQGRIDRMLNYTTRAARIRQVNERSDQRHIVDLVEVLPTLLDEHPFVTDDVELTLPDGARVVVNPLFREAVAELIANAIAYNTGDRTRLSITVDPDRGPAGTTALMVRDDGPGVPEYVPEVFEAGNYDQLVHLDGLGLWFVYWTITDMGGEFGIESDDEGTTITLTLPRPTDDGLL